MIIPSIDLQGGQTVQLIGGAEKALDAGDPRPIAARFGRVGEVAVIDLDAAMGKGDHAALIEEVCGLCDARVGGGIRSVEAAKRWLDAGAAKVILGTAATPELLSKLPKERVIAALDARDGEVVVKGWTEGTGRGIVERMAELRPYVGGFLVTFVEREGRLGGTNLDQVAALVQAAGDAKVTIAGGVTTAEDVAALDKLGADAQVGMALYTGRLSLAQGFAAPLISDRADGLWPTVVCDARGVALGLCWSDLESLTVALDRGVGAYHSRRRGLWVKGETSGATQALLRVEADCDRDALRFTVRQATPGFCHEETWTCFGAARGLGALETTLQQRVVDAPAGSYTRRLLDDPALLRAKLIEEAAELAEAQDPAHVAQEAGDLLYFASVALARAGVSLGDVDAVLDRRARTLSRRPGHAKPPPVEPT
ncbi:MAG: phosphoribosyl-ATP diphosphatase [Deltaproteobacteria bacterium]|nr:phosphoribosyl-ATP diphosphatase [Deltaproteobacteria bacterium]